MKSSPYRKEDLEASAWRAAFAKVTKNKVDVIPPGWHSPDQIAEKLGLCREVAMQKCRDMAKQGMVERRDFHVAWGNVIRARPFYRLVSGKAPRGGAAQKRT